MRTATTGTMLVAALVAACVGNIEDAAMEEGGLRQLDRPSRADFEPVADALQASCGTLDCHGQSGRNLRLFGARGLRLSAAENSASGVTTPAEYDAIYWSVVGLEPELMSAVVRERGAAPERLALIAKARGIEKHKGGTLMKESDALDVCLTRWLAARTDEGTCIEAAPAPPPVSGRAREEGRP